MFYMPTDENGRSNGRDGDGDDTKVTAAVLSEEQHGKKEEGDGGEGEGDGDKDTDAAAAGDHDQEREGAEKGEDTLGEANANKSMNNAQGEDANEAGEEIKDKAAAGDNDDANANEVEGGGGSNIIQQIDGEDGVDEQKKIKANADDEEEGIKMKGTELRDDTYYYYTTPTQDHATEVSSVATLEPMKEEENGEDLELEGEKRERKRESELIEVTDAPDFVHIWQSGAK